MLRICSVAVLSACLSLLAGLAASQQKPEATEKIVNTMEDGSPRAAIPNLTIEVEKREKIAGIPPGKPTIAPVLPLADGGMLVRYINMPTGPPDPDSYHFSFDPVLVRVKSAQETNQFDTSYPGLSGAVSLGKIAVSKDQVVLVVQAVTQEEKRNAPETQPHSFLVFYDLNGSVKKIAPVDVGPNISAIGAFANGEILICDSARAGGNSNRKHLSVYNDKGEFQKELFQDNPDTGLKQGDRSSLPDGQMIAAFPYGDDLLAVYRADKGLLLDELNPSGVAREWDLVLPRETIPFMLIPSDGPFWLVSYEKTGQRVGSSHRVDGIFEFDKATSEVVGNLNSSTPEILMGAVYQRAGEIVGLLNDPKDYSPQFAVARIGGN